MKTSGFVVTHGELELADGVRYAASFGDGRGLMAFDCEEVSDAFALARFGRILTQVPEDPHGDDWDRLKRGPKRGIANGSEHFTLLRSEKDSANGALAELLALGYSCAVVVHDGEGLPAVLVETQGAPPGIPYGARLMWTSAVVDYRDARVAVAL